MSLTLSRGPLADPPPHTVNYRLDAPEHRLFFDAFPRRVRAVLGGHPVLDTTHGMLLHETGALPQLYVPATDVRGELLGRSEHTTHCPHKGEAHYYTARVDGRVVEDAVWSYPTPPPSAGWLRGYQAVAWDAVDAWYDEAEQVFGHLRDPYHRVDTRATTRRVRVTLGNVLLAESSRPVLLSETGLANRLYVPAEDVREDELAPSDTTTVCPYKGTADYLDAGEVRDVAWRYREPLADATAVGGYWCFDDAKVAVRSDTRTAPGT